LPAREQVGVGETRLPGEFFGASGGKKENQGRPGGEKKARSPHPETLI
jgi:hypothetical protein